MTAVPGGSIQLDPTPPGAVRRTTTIEVAPPGAWADGQTLTAIGRDLFRPHSGDATRTNTDELVFDINPAGLIVPHSGRRGVPEELWGRHAQRGLRKHIAGLRSAQRDGGESLLGPTGGLYDSMLDDVVGTMIASGYGRLHDGSGSAGQAGGLASHMSLTCVGFSTMHERGEEFDARQYLAKKPPSIEFVPDDVLVWHQDRSMLPTSFRRRRILQVAPTVDGVVEVTGYFRDTFMTSDGDERVVHEYGLSATVSGPAFVIDSIEAAPGDLPLDHCPLAARTALRLEGVTLAEVDGIVRRDIAGPAACTHLNDELRHLRLVPALLALRA